MHNYNNYNKRVFRLYEFGHGQLYFLMWWMICDNIYKQKSKVQVWSTKMKIKIIWKSIYVFIITIILKRSRTSAMFEIYLNQNLFHSFKFTCDVLQYVFSNFLYHLMHNYKNYNKRVFRLYEFGHGQLFFLLLLMICDNMYKQKS